MSDGFDFLGFHIQWKRKRGTNKWYVYTFIADRPIRSVKAKIRALTHRTSQQHPGTVLIRLNQIMRGWANYFKHAACKRTLSRLSHFVWWRVIRWLRALHRWRWKDVRRRFTNPDGRWKPITANGIELFNLAAVPVTRYRYRGNTIPNPWTLPTSPDGSDRGEPGAVKVARRVRRAAWGNGPGAIPTPRPRPTQPAGVGVLRSTRRPNPRPRPRPNRAPPGSRPGRPQTPPQKNPTPPTNSPPRQAYPPARASPTVTRAPPPVRRGLFKKNQGPAAKGGGVPRCAKKPLGTRAGENPRCPTPPEKGGPPPTSQP